MGVNIWINRRHVYLDIYVRGKRKREKLVGLILIGDKATDRETMRLAEIAKAKPAQQVFAGEWGLTDPVSGKQTLCQYLEKRAKEANGKRKEAMLSTLKHLRAYRGSTLPMGEITDRWLDGLQEYLLSFLAPASVATYCGVIRAALRRAVKDKILSNDPATGVKRIKVPESNKVWLNADELIRLAGTPLPGEAGEDIRRGFIFACYIGLRVSDIKSLTWGDIEQGQLMERQQKTQEKVYIPLHVAAWTIINDKSIHDHREPNGYDIGGFPVILPGFHTPGELTAPVKQAPPVHVPQIAKLDFYIHPFTPTGPGPNIQDTGFVPNKLL